MSKHPVMPTSISHLGRSLFRSCRQVTFGLVLMAAAFAIASTSAFAQPTASQYSQGFETNGTWAPTSTVTRVPSGTNGVTSKSGSFHGHVGTQNTQWGGYNTVFPIRGYTTSVAVYLNVGGGYANDTRFDFTSAINTNAAVPTHRRDFAFNAGYYNDAAAPGTGPRFVISASNSTGRSNSFPKNPARDPFVVTATGWYTLKHKFYANSGDILAVEMSIVDASGNTLHTWILSDPTDTIATIGGNRYGWFASNEFAGVLAIDDSDRSNYIQQSSILVTPAGSPTSTDNDYTRINNAIQSIANNGTITLSGTFNWTEANAAASWAKGSDGYAGGTFGNDDYSILVPANLHGVTFTAASLGAATIQGPGDLAGVNLEGVFYFDGDDAQGWTMSNVRYQDFDLAIGMFNGSGGTDAYNGTVIQNNYIRVPNDLNPTVAPADVSQNIGIHYSFGANQVITGNTIETPGDGVSDGLNISSVVGMQSNTSGGTYDNLQITNNIVRVLNAQSATPSRVLGIWENGHAHSKNITVSGNQFINMHVGNNPALNLQVGFRITSHSSASTTVSYSNNRVEGANVGFQWLAASSFGTHQPVQMTSNLVRNNATGVLVQSQGSATMHANRIVGNSAAAVNNVDGVVNADNNWWGCNYGPGAAGAGCPTAANGNLGTVDADKYLVLRSSSFPNPVSTGMQSSISSNLKTNQDGLDTSGAGTVPNGTLASFTGTLGTVSPATNTTTAGATGTTFTAGGTPGSGNVATLVDGQTVNAGVLIVSAACNNVSAPTGMTALVGAALEVPITTDSLTNRGVISYDFTFTYNSAVLTYNSFDKTGTLSSGTDVSVNSGTPGVLVISGYQDAPLSGAGTLLKLNFTVSGAIGTTSALNFTNFVYNEGTPCDVTANGSFSVISGVISGSVSYFNSLAPRPVAGVVVSAAGATAVSDTTDAAGLYDLAGLGNSAYTVTPSKTGDVMGAISGFDSARIAQHVINISPFNPGGGAALSADVSGDGTISSFDAALIARYTVFLPNFGSTGTWRFVPVNRTYTLAQVQGGMTGQTYEAILMGDVTGNWNGAENPTRPVLASDAEAERTATVLSAPVLKAAADTDIIVPVSIRNAVGKGIVAYSLELAYDHKVIRPKAEPVDVVDTVSRSLSVTVNAETEGVLRVTVFGPLPIDADGTLLSLRFSSVGWPGKTSPLTWTGMILNEGEPRGAVVDGSVTLTESDVSELTGTARTPTGEASANARVTITDSTGIVSATTTDATGSFRFGGVKVGETYTLRTSSGSTIVSITQKATNVDLIAQP